MAGTKRRLCACRLIGEVAGDGLVCCIESCTTVVAAVGPRRVSSVVSIDLRLRRIRRSAEGDGCSRVCRLCDNGCGDADGLADEGCVELRDASCHGAARGGGIACGGGWCGH